MPSARRECEGIRYHNVITDTGRIAANTKRTAFSKSLTGRNVFQTKKLKGTSSEWWGDGLSCSGGATIEEEGGGWASEWTAGGSMRSRHSGGDSFKPHDGHTSAPPCVRKGCSPHVVQAGSEPVTLHFSSTRSGFVAWPVCPTLRITRGRRATVERPRTYVRRRAD